MQDNAVSLGQQVVEAAVRGAMQGAADECIGGIMSIIRDAMRE